MSITDTTQGAQAEPETFDDERDEGSPEGGKPGEAGTVLDLKANPEPPEGKGALTAAAALVPVSERGAAPTDFSHQITIAQYMAKANLMVPKHFHGNVGDCLAIIDISTRAGLSPYMVAGQTYVDPAGKGLAFQSQLYHAFLINSGWLKDAALHVKYEGDGDERRCTVWGTLKGETTPRYHTSPPLKDLLPAKNDRGQYKGSPLWGDKPDVQMFYDTSRDWGRMFSPIATLGMLAQYEGIEHPINPPQPTDSGDNLRTRLKSANNTEGHQNGHAERELAQVAAETGTISPAGGEPARPAASAKGKPAGKATEKSAPKAQPKAATKPKPGNAAAKAAADRAQALGDARRREAAEKTEKAKAATKTDTPAAKVPTKPKNAAEYEVYAEDWINRAADPEKVMERWDKERDTREELVVRMPVRNRLRSLIEMKHGV